MRLIRLIFISLLLLFIAAPTFAQEVKAGKAMIVLDASGSMWGQIEGEAKIAIARKVIRDLLKGWDPRIELGFAAYGHRQKGDCNDIEVLVPVGKNREQLILGAVNRLQPKGKTPLSDAVRMAAESLKYTEEQATVILVSDGKETCDADPCALGEALEGRGVDFTAHVIGFDVKKDEEQGLRCLAQHTGGLYVPASDAGGLKTALETTVTEVKKKVEVVQVVEAPPVKKEEVKKEQGVKLNALYKEGGAEYQGDINWFVLDTKKDLSGKRKQLANKHRGKTGHIFRDLPPGKHVVVAELSDARYIRREYEIEVKQGDAVIHELPLNIGTVRFDGKLAEGGEPYGGDFGWYVLSPKTDLSGKHQELTNFWRKKSGSIFLLPAGEWLIKATLPDARYINTSKKITVEPAGEEAHEFIVNAGHVRFDGFLAEGGEPFKGDLGWYVLSPKADLSGKRKELTNFWRKKSGSVFLLPAGKWLIRGTLPDARYIGAQKEITVVPAGEEAHGFVFNAATVKLEAKLAEGSAPFKGSLGWYILSPKPDLAGNHKELTNFWRKSSGSVFLLPAGEWRLRGTLPDHRHVNAYQNFTLQPGEEQVQTMVFNAGEVKIDVTVNEEPFAGQVGWDVLEAKADVEGKRNRVVNAWRVNSGRVTILHQGDYVVGGVLPDERGTKGEAPFSVTAGESKTVTVNLQKAK